MRYLCKPSRVILLLLLANSCHQPDSNNTEADFTGRWTNAGQPTHQVRFGADGSFFIFQDGKPLGNGRLGPLTYEVFSEQNDTMAIIRMEGLAEPFARYRLKKRGKQLILISMKEGEAWKDHIDEVLVFLPAELESTKGLDAYPGKMPRQQFLLPEGFTGSIYIAYGQEFGEKAEFDAQGRPLFNIPAGGMLETQVPDDPVAFALGAMQFYYTSAKGAGQRTIPLVPTDVIRPVGEAPAAGSGQYHPDSVYVWAMGYNQLGRNSINRLFGKAVEGNVGMFGVDTLRKLQNLSCVDPD